MFVAAGGSDHQLPPHFFECHGLDENFPRSGQSCQKQALASEQRALDASYELNVVGDAFLESDNAARLHLQALARREREFDMVASGVNKGRAGAGELFENESLAAEQAGAQPLRERDIEFYRRLRAQKGIALHQDA